VRELQRRKREVIHLLTISRVVLLLLLVTCECLAAFDRCNFSMFARHDALESGQTRHAI
jgi:hypothetical protein